MNDGPSSDLDAPRNILEEAHDLPSTITLPQGHAEQQQSLAEAGDARRDP